MNPSPIADKVAIGMILERLKGLKGFDGSTEGVSLRARVLQEHCLSVDHAREALRGFDHEYPSPREMKQVIWSLRPKFESKVDQRREWEKQYGPPDPEWSEHFAEKAGLVAKPVGKKTVKEWEAEKRAMRLQAIRDTLFYTESPGVHELDDIQGKQDRNASKAFWASALRTHERDHPEELAAIRAGREPEMPKQPDVAPERRITAEMISAAEPWHGQKCSKCNGTGRQAFDEYCTCPWGINLRKQEESGSA